jgi:hypothetical protein
VRITDVRQSAKNATGLSQLPQRRSCALVVLLSDGMMAIQEDEYAGGCDEDRHGANPPSSKPVFVDLSRNHGEKWRLLHAAIRQTRHLAAEDRPTTEVVLG